MNVPFKLQVLSRFEALLPFRRWLRPFPYDDYVDPVVSILTNLNVRAFVSTLLSLECLSMTVMALRSIT